MDRYLKTPVMVLIGTIIAIIVITFAGRWLLSKIFYEKTNKELCNISLQVVEGPKGGDSVLILRLFSRHLQQIALDDAGKKCLRENVVTVNIPERSWREIGIISFKDKSDTKKIRLKGHCLASDSPSGKVKFQEDTVYQVLYKIPTSAISKANEIIFAQLKTSCGILVSNNVNLTGSPSDEFEDVKRKIHVSLLLGNNEDVLSLAQKLVSLRADQYEGYWYKGRALEEKGAYSDALESYKKAISVYKVNGKNLAKEPEFIAKRIIRLKRIGGLISVNSEPGKTSVLTLEGNT